jgi:hypothetical protein
MATQNTRSTFFCGVISATKSNVLLSMLIVTTTTISALRYLKRNPLFAESLEYFQKNRSGESDEKSAAFTVLPS